MRPSCRSRCSARRLRDAHPPVLFRGESNRVLRPRRSVLPLDVGKAFIAGQLRSAPRSARSSPVGQLLQATGSGYEGAGVRGLVTPKPLRARAGAALSPRQGAATRMELRCPDPACNPYLRSPRCCRPGSRGSSTATSSGADGEEPLHLSPDERKRLGFEQLRMTLRRGDRARRSVRTDAAHARRAHVQPLRSRSNGRKWDDYRVQVTPVGARALPCVL